MRGNAAASGTAFRLEFGFGRRSGWNGLEFVGEERSCSLLEQPAKFFHLHHCSCAL